MQPVLLPGTRAELTPLGLQRTSMGENKLLLYLITRNNILRCIFPSSSSPLSFSLPYIVQWFLTSISYPHYSSDIFFPIAIHLPYLSLDFSCLFFFLFSSFSAFLSFTFSCFASVSMNGIHSTWFRTSSVATWISHLVSIYSQKTRISTFGAQFVCAILDTYLQMKCIHPWLFLSPLLAPSAHSHSWSAPLLHSGCSHLPVRQEIFK